MDLSKVKTLVVDDMPSMRMMIKAVLRDVGMVDVREAPDGEKAAESLDGAAVDLVICDWDMPKMNGLELLKRLRNDERHKGLPFIMLTANAQRDHVVEAIDAGVSDYLAKPFQPAELVRKILQALRAAGASTGRA
ncbi:MAG: response regulator [Gammaproteobacteria bacterium]|nr:response regulator [Gammaproteobacteria bacterium]